MTDYEQRLAESDQRRADLKAQGDAQAYAFYFVFVAAVIVWVLMAVYA